MLQRLDPNFIGEGSYLAFLQRRQTRAESPRLLHFVSHNATFDSA
jgi:hypothetical protein